MTYYHLSFKVMTCHQRFEGVHSFNKHCRAGCDEDNKKEGTLGALRGWGRRQEQTLNKESQGENTVVISVCMVATGAQEQRLILPRGVRKGLPAEEPGGQR